MRLPKTVSTSLIKLNPALFQPQLAQRAMEEKGAALSETEVPKDERKLHEQILAWCNVHEPPLVYIHSRMDKRATLQPGACDIFVFWEGRVAGLELKVGYNKLTVDQEKFHEKMRVIKTPVTTAYTFHEAITFLKEALKL